MKTSPPLHFLLSFVILFSAFAAQAGDTPDGGKAVTPDHETPTFSRYIDVDLTHQQATYLDHGKVLWSSTISSGRDEKPTPPGSYEISDKHQDWTSTIYHVPMPYFMRLSVGEVGLHAGLMTSYPGSAGCIRLPLNEARDLFEITPVGTRVVVHGTAPTYEECMKRERERSTSFSRGAAAFRR